MPHLAEYDITHPFEATVKESVRITPEESKEEVRHIVLEIPMARFEFRVGQNIGVLVPGPHEFGNPHHLRLYSIASAAEGETGQRSHIAICVKRCSYIDDVSGERHKGVASNYLCNSKPGDMLTLTGPYGLAFEVPDNPSANLLMVGLGTGIAPFRAFIRHIYETLGGWKGKVRLFYGARSGLELLYRNDLNRDLTQYYDQETFKAFEAVSPRPHLDEPIALQRALEQNAQEVWSLMLDPFTYVYVAGLEKVAEMFDNALSKIAGSEDKWQRRKAELKAGRRWSETIY
jgi:ferredoxin--NADP+ reductase